MVELDEKSITAIAGDLADVELDTTTIADIVGGRDNIVLPAELANTEKEKEATTKDLHALIGEMSVPQKIKLAIFGNKLARAILIRDNSCRQIPLFVLQNPRITESEIEDIAKSTSVDEQILRNIANSSQWMKNYSVKLAIVSNPRVPLAVSLHWLKYLQDKDLRKLSQSKNIPQALATNCRKIIEAKQQAQKSE